MAYNNGAMKPVLLILASFAALSAFADEAEGPKSTAPTPKDKVVKAQEPEAVATAPRWLEKKLKPIVKKTVVTR